MPRLPSGRGRALLQNLTLAAGSIVVVFGGTEVLLRATGLAPSYALRSAEIKTLDRIPGLYTPGQEFTDTVRRDLPAEIRINNLGFRGPDMEEKKPPGVFRIMALGDSYTFGDHVDTAQAYPARLEALLAERLPGRRVEVVNAGANGFSILDESALWKKAGARLDPDVVLITFSPNDISDMTRPVPLIEEMRRHAETKGSPFVGPVLRLLQRTAIFNGLQILAARIRIRTGGNAAIPAVEPSRAGPKRAPGAWEAYRKALVGLGGRMAVSGRKTLLVHYPSYGNVTGTDEAYAASVLPGWAAAAHMAYLDMLPAFRESAARGAVLYLVPKDSHPSPEGQALAAETIGRELDRLGWLPSPPPAS